MNDLDEKILELYDEFSSIKAVSKRTKCSWNRVVKSLSTSGVVINQTHALILNYYEKGLSPSEIANQMEINVKTVQAYLPRVRPVYGEDLSKNALKIKRWRGSITNRRRRKRCILQKKKKMN